ncbi:hypothetical protein KSS87_019187, partial [Heliosperma pusillum]
MNGSSVRQHLHSCLYTINIGSNDYLNNYFVPEYYNSSRQYNPHQFADRLIAQYSRQLTTLYKNGARKMAVFGLGMVGCTLGEIVRFRPKELCVDSMNTAVTLFNNRLEILLHRLNNKLPGSKFSFINVQTIEVGPQQGITVLDKPCCILREDFQCKESSTPCSDRSSHFFWDGFHPTEAVNRVTGAAAFQALSLYDEVLNAYGLFRIVSSLMLVLHEQKWRKDHGDPIDKLCCRVSGVERVWWVSKPEVEDP